ncbi:hypothetical protein FB451DRAFT_1173436 [Mycena latifolia]|nr:hypothetical protein FB451DRAFT_1173436 [Mycena latifolia]
MKMYVCIPFWSRSFGLIESSATVKVTYKGTTTLTISPAIGTTNILNKDGTVTIPATMDKIEFTVEGSVVASVLRNTTTNKLQILGGAEVKGTGSLEFNVSLEE